MAVQPAVDVLSPWRARLVGLEGIEPPVVVGCSGGPDSLALLTLVVDRGLAPVAVHVDHGLRPGSAAEVGAVAARAASLGADFAAATIRIEPGSNLEARAREGRYRALEEVRDARGASAVLVGHTADDQAETVLLNLLRGSAAAGLGAMAPRRGTVVRPLLGLRRGDTVAVCEAVGLVPLRDPTNDDRTQRRSWLRHEVLPLLATGAERDLVPVLARQAEVLRAESEFLDDLARAAWPPDPRDPAPPAAPLAALTDVLARRAVRLWIGPPPPSFDEVERVRAVARGDIRATQLAGDRRVSRSGGRLRLTGGSVAG